MSLAGEIPVPSMYYWVAETPSCGLNARYLRSRMDRRDTVPCPQSWGAEIFHTTKT